MNKNYTFYGIFKYFNINSINTNKKYKILKLREIFFIENEEEKKHIKDLLMSDEICQRLTLEDKEKINDPYEQCESLYNKLEEKYFKKDEKKHKLTEINDLLTKSLCNKLFEYNEEKEMIELGIEEQFSDLKNEIIDKYQKLDKSNEIMSFKKAFDEISKVVLGQDDQIKQILCTINDNMNAINSKVLTEEEKRKKKQNILISGPTGVGKSEIANQIGKIYNIPVVIEDMTRFTEAGYVGADIDSIYTHLLEAANGNIELAQKSILVLDEFDKLASCERGTVSREGVQNSLLKLLEGGKQYYSAGSSSNRQEKVFDTSNLTIFMMGAFEGIEKIKNERIQKSNKRKIGFIIEEEETEKYIDKRITTEDYNTFGIDSQILGRAQCKVNLNELSIDDLIKITRESKLSSIKINIKLFLEKGVKLTLTEDYYSEVAKYAKYIGCGARSISQIVEDSIREANLEIQDDKNIDEIILNSETVKNNKIYTIKRK